MLLEYLLMPRAGDLTDPDDIGDSYGWVLTDEPYPVVWTLEEEP